MCATANNVNVYLSMHISNLETPCRILSSLSTRTRHIGKINVSVKLSYIYTNWQNIFLKHGIPMISTSKSSPNSIPKRFILTKIFYIQCKEFLWFQVQTDLNWTASHYSGKLILSKLLITRREHSVNNRLSLPSFLNTAKNTCEKYGVLWRKR